MADFLEGAEPRQQRTEDQGKRAEKERREEEARKFEISAAKDKQIVYGILTQHELRASLENLRKEVLKQRFMGEELNFKINSRLLQKRSMVFSYQLTLLLAGIAFLASWMLLGRN